MKIYYGALAAVAIDWVVLPHEARTQDVYCGPLPSGSTTRITSDVNGDVKVVGACTIIGEPDDIASVPSRLR